jgi:hypothetical protein
MTQAKTVGLACACVGLAAVVVLAVVARSERPIELTLLRIENVDNPISAELRFSLESVPQTESALTENLASSTGSVAAGLIQRRFLNCSPFRLAPTAKFSSLLRLCMRIGVGFWLITGSSAQSIFFSKDTVSGPFSNITASGF